MTPMSNRTDPQAFGPLPSRHPGRGAVIAAEGDAVTAHRPRTGGQSLNLRLDRHLTRWRDGAGASVFELVARALALESEPAVLLEGLGPGREPLVLRVLERSRHLVEPIEDGRALGINRLALSSSRLSPRSCLVAAGIVHGLRAAAARRAGRVLDREAVDRRDLKSLLLLLIGVRGTEWDAGEIRKEFEDFVDASDPLLARFQESAAKLAGTMRKRSLVVLDDRVFRDGALFDRLPGREKLRVVLAGTMAWYGLLSLGLLRLPRRYLSKRNPYYETAWWILRAKPGGRRLFKGALFARSMQRLRQFRILLAFELIWSAYSPTLATTCLRPVYRATGGNRRPFLATMATFAYTALIIHPLWVTLLITGLAFWAGRIWPWVAQHTRLANIENLILHGIVIGFWLSVGLLVATSKWLRRLGS
jgi:hypothetical protein